MLMTVRGYSWVSALEQLALLAKMLQKGEVMLVPCMDHNQG